MANKYNKIIYGGKTLIDLTADTITADKLLEGMTAHDKSGETIIGTCTFDSDTQDATVAVAEMLEGKTAYARGAKLTGTMPNNGAENFTFSQKTQEFIISQGYHDGSGTVKLDATEMAKLIPNNIREGVQILGVTGTMDDLEGVKAQAKSVTPATTEQTVLPDADFNYLTQVTVAAIPYVESDNSAGGITVTIGG